MANSVHNATRQCLLAEKVRLCRSFLDRLKGLLGSQKLDEREACWIRPCSSVHTFGMRYPIDVYFLNKKNEVMAVSKRLKPNRLSPVYLGACSVIEFASGPERECHIGDKLSLGSKGQASVELALTLLIFLAFMLVLSDMIKVCYHWVSLQYAVSEAARFGSLGNATDGLNREASIEKKVVDMAEGLGVKGVRVSLRDQGGNNTAGEPLAFFSLLAQKTVTLNPLSGLMMKFTGDYSGSYVVNAQAVTRNEPFNS